MRLFNFIYPPIFVVSCVLIGSWYFAASFAVTLLFVFAGATLGTIIHWSEEVPGGIDNPHGEFILPKWLLLIFGTAAIAVAAIIHLYPSVREYGFG